MTVEPEQAERERAGGAQPHLWRAQSAYGRTTYSI